MYKKKLHERLSALKHCPCIFIIKLKLKLKFVIFLLTKQRSRHKAFIKKKRIIDEYETEFTSTFALDFKFTMKLFGRLLACVTSECLVCFTTFSFSRRIGPFLQAVFSVPYAIYTISSTLFTFMQLNVLAFYWIGNITTDVLTLFGLKSLISNICSNQKNL